MVSVKANVHFMELGKNCMKLLFAFFCLSITTTTFTQCEAKVPSKPLTSPAHPKHISSSRSPITKSTYYVKKVTHLEMDPATDLTNTQPYVSSPFTLPPFDSLAPLPLPQDTPPYCEYPPSVPQPPSTQIPTPMIYTTPSPPPTTSYSAPIVPAQNPPPSPTFDVPSPPETSPTPNPPEYGPSPPSFTPGTPGTPEYVPTPPDYYVPGPPETVPGTPGYESSPPIYIPSPSSYTPRPPETGTPGYEPSPPIYIPSPPETGTPGYEPSPPIYIPSPSGYTPSPPETGTPGYEPSPPIYIPSPSGYTPSPVFQPPVIYPHPSVPPPPHKGPHYALWCVVKPSVPDPIIQEAMNYACGSGADCESIQPTGSCYQPDTLYAHASYAFNSYWQRTKVAGGTCDFGGTGMLVTVDPSFDGCTFIYY